MFIIVTLLLVGIFLRAYQLDRALGGGDENQALLEWVYTPMNYILAPAGDPRLWNLSLGYGFDHIFNNIVLRMMVLLFGEENALAIRAPAFVAGIACLWVVYKIARQISPSKAVARLALLTIVVCPIHIYYSQTARGYSFVIFFSALSIYATLKLLKSDKNFIWGLILFLSGILSAYTIPLTAIFFLGLAIWILLVLTIPILKAELGLHQELISRKFYQFLTIFLLMGGCSVLLYWPHIDGMLQLLNEFDIGKVDSQVTAGTKSTYFILNFFVKIFPGPLVYFTPFILIGIFWSKTYSLAYRFLPVVILLTTYFFTLITGLEYYPRGYLFTLPLLLIFLASGFIWAGEYLGNLIKQKTYINWVCYSLVGAYVALTLTEIFLNYYPSIKTFNVKDYTQKLSSQIQKNDLLLVADGRFYLYARSLYKKNLRNIITDNHLGGIKLIVDNDSNAADYKVNSIRGMSIFLNWKDRLKEKIVFKDRKLFDLKNINSISLLPEDFEATTDWHVQSGDGEFALLKEHKFAGKYSLLAKASSGKDMVLRGLFGDIELNQPHLAVLVWSTKKFASNDKYFMPAVGVSYIKKGKKYYSQIPFGKTNAGMNLHIKEKTLGEEIYYWQIHSAIGLIHPGKFSLNLFLRCEAGKSIIYDSMRLFLIRKSPLS